VLLEPLSDVRHAWFESAGDREIKHASSDVASIFKVVSNSSRYKHERARDAIDPLFIHEDAHRLFNDVEHVVVGMRVRTWPFGMRLEPLF
jgi:hypothetical protein